MARNNKVYAYAGEILRVNLTTGKIWTEPTLKYAKDWLGSSGIAIKILYDELRSWVTPYEPANKLIFGAGALLGTPAPAANKGNFSTLGPMIGGWASGCSDTYLGAELKYAGYDSIVIEGKAHSPVYLWINDGCVEIRDASDLWGKTTWETLDMVRKDLSDPGLHAASIGPAGENLVRGACVIQDKGRGFGRCGTGAVMGSKNLKTIVAKGTGAIKVAEPKRFMEAVTRAREIFKGLNTTQRMRNYGTLMLQQRKQDICGHNYKNFQDLRLPDEMAEVVDPIKTIEKYMVSHQSFPGCPIGCGRKLYITEGPYAGLITESPQWEVSAALQGRLAIELMRKISYREGFGNILAEGNARAADIIGRKSSYYAHNIKGQDLYETCRGHLSWLLGVTTSTRGGGHTTGAVEATPSWTNVERAKSVFGVDNPDKALEYEGKAKQITYTEMLHRVNNCLGICHFATVWIDAESIDLPQIAEIYSAATGWETSVEDLKRLATRMLNLEKAFNLRFTNFDRKDDMPVPRDISEPIPSGNLAGWKLDINKYNEMLDEYYDLHGWDRKTSFPTRKTLVDLGLEGVANDLEKIGKLG
jgi:aldehyde:ferredoxin oxidoreductase